MKITIKANPSRGEEIISLLESLGGINDKEWEGNGDVGAYYIDENNIIRYNCTSIDYKVYTLEEFKKEFPFKIGDRVMDCSDNEIGRILGFIDIDGELMYIVNFEKSGHANMPVEELKPYKEMQERNVTLTLSKAKEWHRKGGELKEIALQAYSEEELTKIELPKSWEEFCDNYMIDDSEAYFDNCCTVHSADKTCRNSLYDRNICPSKKSAKAHLALIQLEQLRDCWRQGWEPIWDISEKWCIRLWGNELVVGITTNISRFLTFPTREMTEAFLECFRDLIEKAGDLI